MQKEYSVALKLPKITITVPDIYKDDTDTYIADHVEDLVYEILMTHPEDIEFDYEKA